LSILVGAFLKVFDSYLNLNCNNHVDPDILAKKRMNL